AQGEPFVGRAGQLLTDIIERGMGLTRPQVYICNVIKCRPPENRNPEPDEVAACEPFLFRQIDLVQPRVIVGLGAFAVHSLLKVETPISKLRGVWHNVRGVRMMPTFHPSYLLRNPADKRLVWADIQEVMRTLGRPLPARGARS
ncbi:MAG: uracil-DNA glycosylase, partial [Candidatus Binataceae bacterium]